MKQRSVTDQDNTTWTCVQAYAGLNGETEASERAAEISSDEQGHVAVVCTPSGGAQSVRLALSPDWDEALPDRELLKAIAGQQQQEQEQ
jgi:hypothetical protein